MSRVFTVFLFFFFPFPKHIKGPLKGPTQKVAMCNCIGENMDIVKCNISSNYHGSKFMDTLWSLLVVMPSALYKWF